MPFSIAIPFILLSVVSVSYGWGLRGTTIGGEKGAMLPGAIMGLLIAVFSGSAYLRENFFFLAALGSAGMFFGGCDTYGETLGLTMNSRPALNMKKGLIALFVKGFLWFSIFGAFVGLGLAALTGKYFTVGQIAAIFAIMPVSMIGFYFIFNRPLNPKNGKFPKIYFSLTRQESWGALFGIFLVLMLVSIFKKLAFPISYSLFCGLFGGVGWIVGQLMQVYCQQYAAGAKSAFGRFWGKPYIGGWKVMECVLGAFGGLGASLGIVLFYKQFSALHTEAFWNPLPNLEKPLAYAFLGILAIDIIHYFVSSKKIKIVFEALEFPIYAILPLLFVFLGNRMLAVLSSFFTLFWVIAQETAFEPDKKLRHTSVWKIVFSILGIGAIAVQFISDYTFTLLQTLLLYGVVYEIITLGTLLPKNSNKRKGRKDSSLCKYLFSGEVGTVHGYFLICIVIMTVGIMLY